jgi:hypothetical protein
MITQADKSSFLPVLITGIAVILFSSAGVARKMGWGPNSTDDSGDILALEQAAPVPTTSAARAQQMKTRNSCVRRNSFDWQERLNVVTRAT